MNESFSLPASDHQSGDVLRVIIVAAYPTVQFGLRAVVEDDGLIVVEAVLDDLAGIPASVEEFDPDCFVADIPWTPEELAEVGDLGEWPPMLLLIESAEDALAALTSGVRGALLRDAGTDEIQAAIVALAAGLTVLDPRLLGSLGWSAESPSSTAAADIEPLTNREIDVLELIAAGLTNKGIAGELGISEHTVKFHVGSILSKFNAASRSEAIARAMQAGLLHV